MTPFRSLVGRLVFAFLLPSLIIVILVAWIAYLRATVALRQSVFEKLESIAVVKEAALTAWVGQLFRSVTLLSELPEWVETAADLTSPEVPLSRRRTARERMSRLVKLVLERQPSLTEVIFLRATGGEILVSTEERHEGQFRLYDRYYMEGRRAPFVQNIYPSPVTLRPTLTISAPVRTEGGEVLGVLAAHLSLEYLDENILQRTGLGRTGAVTLVDRHKLLVTGSRYGETTLGAAPASRAIEEVIRGRSSSGLYRDLAGAEVLGVYRWLDDREMGLIVEIRQHEALAPARRLLLSILLPGSFFVVLLVGGIYLVARRIARPILEITDAAARVQEGDLTSRAPSAAADEIGVLARTFNGMVEQLATDRDEKRREGKVREALIDELEAKNAELERFTYTVSHDLKSPLLTIKGFLGYLGRDLERGDTDRARSDFRRISAAATKMEQLLEELLELSRIGRVTNTPEELSFGELAQEVVESLRGREAAEGVELGVVGELPGVFGDRVRLQEVLENLVENALKFIGDQRSPRVEIGCRSGAGDPVFYVRDNGIGIDPEYHEKVFGLFDRLDSKVEGTGIGLAIVRRIVEVHGGRIWIESAGTGRGSTFCFTLPAGFGRQSE